MFCNQTKMKFEIKIREITGKHKYVEIELGLLISLSSKSQIIIHIYCFFDVYLPPPTPSQKAL